MKTKAEVQRWCDVEGVEIIHSKPDVMNPVHHVHVDIMVAGKIFRFHGLHNLGLWDECVAPDWRAIGRDLVEADLGPCDIKDCEYCA